MNLFKKKPKIETWTKTTTYIVLHPKEDYELSFVWHPEWSKKDRLDNYAESYDIESIDRLDKSEDGNAILWVLKDDQGGGMNVEVLENYNDVYDIVTSSSLHMKHRLGKRK